MYVRSRFGLPARSVLSDFSIRDLGQRATHAAEQLEAALPAGGIGLISGPSGSGKSLTLSAFAAITGALAVTGVSCAARRAPIAIVRGDLDRSLAILAAVGLGEARRLVTPAGLLSEGERSRLALARAIGRSQVSGGSRDIVCDEFTSTLDRLTARSVCRCIRRALSLDQRLVCATAHDDIAPHLDPDVVVYVPLAGPPDVLTREDGHADGIASGVA